MRLKLFAFISSIFLAIVLLLSPSQQIHAQTPAAPDAAKPTPPDVEAPVESTTVPVAEEAAAAKDAATPAENIPANLRLRQLEQRVQSLKERAWRAKARVGMLKESVLGGGVGARANITHVNKMGKSFRLIKLVYALDGTQVFGQSDSKGDMYKDKKFEILNGPISPGSHTLSVLAIYQGHGYGVLKYMKNYKYTVRSSHTFNASEGKGTILTATAFEKGGLTTPVEDRPAIDFKLSFNNNAEE